MRRFGCCFRGPSANSTHGPLRRTGVPRITYITSGGTEYAAMVEAGYTLMEGALLNDIPGIDADCGGNCICATCRIYLDEEWLNRVPASSDAEKALLEYAANGRHNCRLSCQIEVSDALAGLVVRLPAFQR